jgi:hypothetical protein
VFQDWERGAFAEEAKGLAGQMGLLDIDRDEFNFRFGDK